MLDWVDGNESDDAAHYTRHSIREHVIFCKMYDSEENTIQDTDLDCRVYILCKRCDNEKHTIQAKGMALSEHKKYF
jgi:hypothetical protein